MINLTTSGFGVCRVRIPKFLVDVERLVLCSLMHVGTPGLLANDEKGFLFRYFEEAALVQSFQRRDSGSPSNLRRISGACLTGQPDFFIAACRKRGARRKREKWAISIVFGSRWLGCPFPVSRITDPSSNY